MCQVQKKIASFFVVLCLYSTCALASNFEDGSESLAKKSKVDSRYDSLEDLSPNLENLALDEPEAMDIGPQNSQMIPCDEERDTLQALKGSCFELLSDKVIVHIFKQKGASYFYGVCSHFRNILRNSKDILPNIVFSYNYRRGFVNKDPSVLGAFQKAHAVDLVCSDVTDVSMLGGVHTLYLSGTQVKDVSMLGDVHTLYLSGTQVEDVSKLGNVHTLDLCETRVENFSMLGNVRELFLQGTCIENVSMLGNVHTLDLCGTKIENVSDLGGVHTLTLEGTPVTNVSALGNVHDLNLSSTPVIDVSALGNVHTLNLSFTFVEDVSMLGKVHTLYLYGTHVTDENIARLKAINPNVIIHK